MSPCVSAVWCAVQCCADLHPLRHSFSTIGMRNARVFPEPCSSRSQDVSAGQRMWNGCSLYVSESSEALIGQSALCAIGQRQLGELADTGIHNSADGRGRGGGSVGAAAVVVTFAGSLLILLLLLLLEVGGEWVGLRDGTKQVNTACELTIAG